MSGLVLNAQPIITNQPADQTANQGYSATFQVGVTYTPPPDFQWYFNSGALSGAITNELSITNAIAANAGDYFVIVSDATGSVTSRVASLTVVPPAVLDPKVGPNIRMGQDPAQLPPGATGEVEPYIIRSFSDPNLIAATWSDGRPPDNSIQPANGYSISRDGGLTWTRGLTQNLTPLTGGPFSRTADPVVAVDLSGSIYITTGNFVNDTNWPIVVSKLTNGTETFAQPVMVPFFPTNTDKAWIAINTYPNSPTANRIAVTADIYDGNNNSLGVQASYSDDGGVSWSKPTLITRQFLTGTQPVFLPDGSLVVLSTDWLNSRIDIALSANGGQTFGTSRLVTPYTRYDEPNARAWGIFPSATTDRQAGVIYTTYQTALGSGTNARPAIMFTRSIDRGQTWKTPVAVNDTPNQRSVFTPAIAASPDGQHLLIEFYDKRNDTGRGYLVDLYVAESFDGGNTWEPNLRLSEFTFDMRRAPLATGGFGLGGYFFGDYIGIVPALGLNADAPAVACWMDTRSGSSDPFSVRIQRTKGTSFETWRQLRFSTNDLANLAISGEGADPDGDGIPNLAEYALGLEPTHHDPPPMHSTIVRDARGYKLHLTYSHLAVLADIEFAWESSDDLATWQPDTPAQETVEGTGSWRTRTAEFLIAPFGQRYFRATVKRTP